MKNLASGKTWFSGPSEDSRDLVSGCPGVGAFCIFHTVSFSCPCRAHICTPRTSLGHSHTSPQMHTPSNTQTGLQTYSWTIYVHRFKKDLLGEPWVTSPNLMLWKWEKGGFPKEKVSCILEGEMDAGQQKQISSTDPLPERDGVGSWGKKTCPSEHGWFFFLQKRHFTNTVLFNLQRRALHNPGEMLRSSRVFREFLYWVTMDECQRD